MTMAARRRRVATKHLVPVGGHLMEQDVEQQHDVDRSHRSDRLRSAELPVDEAQPRISGGLGTDDVGEAGVDQRRLLHPRTGQRIGRVARFDGPDPAEVGDRAGADALDREVDGPELLRLQDGGDRHLARAGTAQHAGSSGRRAVDATLPSEPVAARYCRGMSEVSPQAGRVADHYADRTDEDSQTAPAEVRAGLERFLAEFGPRGPLVDVGSGIGGNLPVLSSHAATVGCEISASAALLASARGRVVVADAGRLPLAGAAFGAAVCTEVLEHVDDPRAVFAEMARVLRPGGLAYVTTPNYANLAGLHKLLADRRSGRHDWNPWGAHHGGYEAFMTGRRLWRAAAPHLDLVRVRGLDYGQALTGRFAATDRLALSRPGQAVVTRLLPRLYGRDGVLAWHGMHVELVLRRR